MRGVVWSEKYYWYVKCMIGYNQMWGCNYCYVVVVAWLLAVICGDVIIVVLFSLHYRISCIICYHCGERGKLEVQMLGLVIYPKLRERARGSDVRTRFIWVIIVDLVPHAYKVELWVWFREGFVMRIDRVEDSSITCISALSLS